MQPGVKKVEVTLDNEAAQALELEASRLGLRLDAYLVKIIQRRPSDPLPGAPAQWMPRQEWEALVRGEGCPLCAMLESNVYANDYGYTIADLSISRLRLAANQSVPGYCYLFCKKHVREPYHLGKEERGLFFEDLMRAAQAIEQVFQPIKMNLEMQGNLVPHLHCHIKPRYYGDPAPGAPIHPDRHPIQLTPAEYEERVRLIREALRMIA